MSLVSPGFSPSAPKHTAVSPIFKKPFQFLSSCPFFTAKLLKINFNSLAFFHLIQNGFCPQDYTESIPVGGGSDLRFSDNVRCSWVLPLTALPLQLPVFPSATQAAYSWSPWQAAFFFFWWLLFNWMFLWSLDFCGMIFLTCQSKLCLISVKLWFEDSLWQHFRLASLVCDVNDKKRKVIYFAQGWGQ